MRTAAVAPIDDPEPRGQRRTRPVRGVHPHAAAALDRDETGALDDRAELWVVVADRHLDGGELADRREDTRVHGRGERRVGEKRGDLPAAPELRQEHGGGRAVVVDPEELVGVVGGAGRAPPPLDVRRLPHPAVRIRQPRTLQEPRREGDRFEAPCAGLSHRGRS
jgi:hypothetical protein